MTAAPQTTYPGPANLADYDIILVNTSAGKDSQAMTHLVIEQAKADGLLDRVHMVHADLGRVEWQGVKELAQEHAAHYGVPFHVVKRQQGDILDETEKRGKWPSSSCRWCTSHHKRDQVQKLIVKLGKAALADKPKGSQVRVLNCIGIRAEESPARAKKAAFVFDKRSSSKARLVDTWFPIFHLTVEEVWQVNTDAGTRHHFAYDAGMPRLSCCFCIFAPKAALKLAGKLNPDLLQVYVDLEAKIGHTFKSGSTIASIQEELKTDDTVEAIDSFSWNM